MNLQETLSLWLNEGRLMQLATCIHEQPWICTVGFVSDDTFNIYWFSRNSRRHSIEINQNNKVAATIVHDTRTRQAVQLTGVAQKLPKEEIEKIHALYFDKLGFTHANLDEIKKSEEVSYWVIKPTTIALWDEGNFPDSPRQEYLLSPDPSAAAV